MSSATRRGWIPPRTSPVQFAFVCLVAVAAVFFSAHLCWAAKDFPLTPLPSPPVFSVAGRYEVAYAGKGTFARGGKAKLTLDLDGPPVGAFLYLAGIDAHRRGGDPKVRVAITSGDGRKGTITRVPVLYTAKTETRLFVSRVEITGHLSQGRNTIAISGYDLQNPEGAFAYAVFPGGPGTPQKLIQVRDGADAGYYAMRPPIGPDSEVVSFQFEPSLEERTARVVLAITDGDPGRGDEVFGFTGTGVPSDQLVDTDRDSRIDIVDRSIKLQKKDALPLGVEPANAAGALEAHGMAFSLEEDCLGVVPKRPKDKERACGIGASLNLVDRPYQIPAGHGHADFQVQSENPEKGDSFLLFFALNELPLPDINVLPEIKVAKSADPIVLPEPGGMVRFDVEVRNLGGEDLVLTTLVDRVGDVYRDLDGEGNCAVPQTIALAGSYRCTFYAQVAGTVATPHLDTVEASGVGSISLLPVIDSDDAVVNFTSVALGAIGDQVWNDANRNLLQDNGETGIAGVKVTLRAGGIEKGSVYTDELGRYLFAGLPAGVYTVEVAPSPGLEQTYDLDGLGTPNAANRLLAAGEIAQDVDFGYAPLIPPTTAIAVTKAADPTFGYLFKADPTTPWPYALTAEPLEVAYTVVVTNPGVEPLADVTVTDEPATLVFTYQSGDTNGDAKLDLTEQWLYAASSSYGQPGVYPDRVTAKGTGTLSGTEVTATADASVRAVGCGQCLGKVSELTLRWNGTAVAMIRVEVENNAFKDPVAFVGTVQPGGVFSFGPLFSANGGFNGTLGTNISLYEKIGANDVFTATIHTSCSQPIYPGQDWGPNGAQPSGPFTIVSGSSKLGGLLCPILEQ